MTDFQAALLLSQMKKLDSFKARRQEIVKKYNEAFADIPEIIVQKEIPESDTCRHLYIIRLDLDKLTCTRREFFDALSAENVQPQIHIVVNDIHDKMKEMDHEDYEVILINDCSPDDTFGAIKELCQKSKKVIGINHAKNFGQHSALMAGFHFVSGDVIVCLDDDGQTPANQVDKLLNKIDEGYDVVYAEYEHKKNCRA